MNVAKRVRVYLGLGSNLGDRAAVIAQAVARLQSLGCVRAVSPLYETEPWGLLEQPRFLNGACALDTVLSPLALLDALKAIERELGRIPGPRNGPRPIDLDILLYGQETLAHPRLTIPHPGLLTRATVLVPLTDIAPQVRHPLTSQTMQQHLAALQPVTGIAPFPPGLT